MLLPVSCVQNKGLLYSISVFFINYVSAAENRWIREATFDGKFPVTGRTYISRSRVHCGKTCLESATCVSFFFAPGSSCKLHDHVLSSADGLADVMDAAYYIVDGAEEVSTAPPTTTAFPPFTCPPDDTIFRTVLLSDGNPFTYRVLKTLATQSEAVKICASQHAFLARVTSPAEMEMLRNLMINCTGYSGSSDYYVDGTYVSGSDDDDEGGIWLMNNGEPVPMSNDFWEYGYPNNQENEHCLRMRADLNYMWDDCYCSRMCYIICEQ